MVRTLIRLTTSLAWAGDIICLCGIDTQSALPSKEGSIRTNNPGLLVGSAMVPRYRLLEAQALAQFPSRDITTVRKQASERWNLSNTMAARRPTFLSPIQ